MSLTFAILKKSRCEEKPLKSKDFSLHVSSAHDSSRRPLPQGIVKRVEHLREFAPEDTVEPGEAAAFALEDEVRVVECGAVDNEVSLGLRGDSLQPLTLRRAPGARDKHLLQSV